jgi:hypothetical protein
MVLNLTCNLSGQFKINGLFACGGQCFFSKIMLTFLMFVYSVSQPTNLNNLLLTSLSLHLVKKNHNAFGYFFM